MNIQNLGSTQSYTPAAILTRLTGVDAGGQNVPSSGNNCTKEISADGQAKLNTAKEIMSRYDLRNISYHDLQKLGTELLEKGVISIEDNMYLTDPGFNLTNLPGVDPADPRYSLDTPRDYVSLYEKLLAYEKPHNSKGVEYTEYTLSLFRALASLQPRG